MKDSNLLDPRFDWRNVRSKRQYFTRKHLLVVLLAMGVVAVITGGVFAIRFLNTLEVRQTLDNRGRKTYIIFLKQTLPPECPAECQDHDLGYINATGADWSWAKLQHTQLVRAELRHTIFDSAEMQHVDLRRADARHARFWKAQLVDADMRQAILSWADFAFANLDNANLTGADLHSAILTAASLRRVDFTDADLSETILSKANLREAVLRRANLTQARFAGTLVIAADLRGATLARADLRGADFRESNLEGVDMTGAWYNATNRWPEDFDPAKHGAIIVY